jgi:hypothetical protein
MVHDMGLRPDTEERLQVMLEATRARCLLDDNFVPLFDEALVGFLDKFTIIRKLANNLNIRLQPTHPGSAMPATLTGLYGDNLFDTLVALRLPGISPENVHLEVALAAQFLAQQDTIDIITHVYKQIIHKDHYLPEEDDRTVAFLDRRVALDGLVQKHVDLADNPAAPHRRLVSQRTRARGCR